jgi:hypothetical protein
MVACSIAAIWSMAGTDRQFVYYATAAKQAAHRGDNSYGFPSRALRLCVSCRVTAPSLASICVYSRLIQFWFAAAGHSQKIPGRTS